MANYYGLSRTNYVKVKDPDKLKEALIEVEGLSLIEKENRFGFIFTWEDPGVYINDEMIDFEEWFAPFMEDEEICVLKEIGYEKNNYYLGYAIAFDNKGKRVNVNLDEIYQRAFDEMGKMPERCEY